MRVDRDEKFGKKSRAFNDGAWGNPMLRTCLKKHMQRGDMGHSMSSDQGVGTRPSQKKLKFLYVVVPGLKLRNPKF